MVRIPRSEVFDPHEVEVAHVYSRTVRRCFLFGTDPVSGKNFDHRKAWIENYLRRFAAAFGIDLLGFAILSNHFHLILRSRPDVVATWDDREVARRWLMLCPHRHRDDGAPAEPTPAEIVAIAGCPVQRAEIRKRLSSISWWMRLLCQRVAQRANHEDEETGRFFQDRYRATRLLDEASLVACSAYVDLNPIRAAMSQTLEASDYTSVQKRIESARLDPSPEAADDAVAAENQVPPSQAAAKGNRFRPDGFLSPLCIDERRDAIGPDVSPTRQRCSDKGFLPMQLEDYLQLLNWTAAHVAPAAHRRAAGELPAVLQQLGLERSSWCELVKDFGRLFCTVAGRPECVDATRSHRTHRRYHLRRRVRELLPATG